MRVTRQFKSAKQNSFPVFNFYAVSRFLTEQNKYYAPNPLING